MYALLEERGAVVGLDMLGDRVVMPPEEISVRVVGPFLVEASGTSPLTAHGSVHSVFYVALPGWRYAFGYDEFALS